MEASKQVKKQEQKVAKLERRLAQQKLKRRKADTRNKIQLGGLVVKAKMNKFSKDVILGALVDAFELLEKDHSTETVFRSKGQAAFMGYEEQ